MFKFWYVWGKAPSYSKELCRYGLGLFWHSQTFSDSTRYINLSHLQLLITYTFYIGDLMVGNETEGLRTRVAESTTPKVWILKHIGCQNLSSWLFNTLALPAREQIARLLHAHLQDICIPSTRWWHLVMGGYIFILESYYFLHCKRRKTGQGLGMRLAIQHWIILMWP